MNGHSRRVGRLGLRATMIAGGAGPNSSAAAARSVSFLLLPSELVSQVVVHKSALG